MLKRIGKQRYVLLPGRIEPEPTGIRDRFRTENFYRKKIRYGLGSVKTVPLPALDYGMQNGPPFTFLKAYLYFFFKVNL